MGPPSLFVTPAHANGRRERPPLHPPPLTRWGGGSWLLLLHPVGAAPVPRAAAAKARAALPDRSSKPQAAAPSGRCSRDRSAARARTAAAMHSAAAPASATGVATPSEFRQPRRWRWLPRHPAQARPPPQQRAGRFRSVVSCGPATVQAGHALAQRRSRCPRSMTPGTAAAPAPGCWLRCLRTLRFGNAAGQLLLPEAAKEYGTKPEAAQCPALILRITWLRLCAIAQQLPGARALA